MRGSTHSEVRSAPSVWVKQALFVHFLPFFHVNCWSFFIFKSAKRIYSSCYILIRASIAANSENKNSFFAFSVHFYMPTVQLNPPTRSTQRTQQPCQPSRPREPKKKKNLDNLANPVDPENQKKRKTWITLTFGQSLLLGEPKKCQ